MDSAIVVDGLSKTFQSKEKKAGLIPSIKGLISPEIKNIKALKKISFSIESGELVGFIGPNGAGKTTTMKILSGLLYPTSGFVQVLGFDPWHRQKEYLKKISLIMGQKNQLWWDLPAVDTFELNKAIYEIPDKKYKEMLNSLVDLLEVKDLLGKQVRKLSLGQRMRMELVAALVHGPKVLFLDEPTIGLDVVAQGKMRDFIYDYNRRYGATIMLTSHDMDDVVNLAKRVIIINNGDIIFDGKLTELTQEYAKHKTIHVFLARESDLKKFDSIGEVVKVDYPHIELSIDREVAAHAASEILQNFPVADLNIEEEPLEDIIKRIFQGEK